ncbi:SRPBCC family protein [Paenibacillus agri]|uniref:SRPBCC domain-containing protein n=1 Tax=Paenibacillus agri TaxID=2744309 RepID=A0A850ELP6_9BACL|nr:SRPBCC domain-containing protein [Paenibacillus agri]NUU60427.1 SRPBCC domain-containing protein [Paenibacillus agri]
MITMLNGKYVLTLQHVYNASKERVFMAWTKKEQLEKWWGLVGFTTTIEQMDVAVGGKYRFHMQAPNDGMVFTLEGRYVEIVQNEKLSFTWKWLNEGDEAEETLVTIDFVEQDNKTELVITHSAFSKMNVVKRHHNNWNNALENGLLNYVN